MNVSIRIPADGCCCADGCERPSEYSTLIGLRFCADHYSAFYTADADCTLKFGVVRADPDPDGRDVQMCDYP